MTGSNDMKIAFARCLVGALLGVHAVSLAAGPNDAAIGAITALERKWSEAEAGNKPNLIAPLLAEQAMFTESGGRVSSRDEFLAEERATTYTLSTVEDLKIRVFGNTVIANYLLHQKGTYKNATFDRQIRETDTWVKMPGGAWQVVAVHGTDLKLG